MPNAYVQDPREKLDYYVNWTSRLAGNTIATSTWTTTDPVTLSGEAILAGYTRVWAEGVTLGTLVRMRNDIVLTPSGHKLTQSVLLVIRDK